MEKIKYVIYCRKSTDENSDHQKQSISDQIKACIDYAKRENLEILEKPKDFSDFESEYEIDKENNETDLQNRKIFLETRNLFIIKEQETAKIPGKRRKWNNLIKLVKKGKINGILSYSPDRQARNMVEGGEIIHLVDNTPINLRYTNFHFENNASGKMMLGIWFVFSKQYVDKLSEDIGRGNKNKVLSGKAIGKYKPGYFINKEGYHEPHPKFFLLIKKAFEMKLEGIVESRIKDFLDANGFYREFKSDGRREDIKRSLLNKMFRDDFYYGKFISGDNIADLRELNPYFKAIISEEEFQILQERYYQNPTSLINKTKTKDEYENLKIFDIDFLLTEDNFGLTFNIPNKKRFSNKILEEGKKGNKITLEEIIKPHQINYRCANKDSKNYGLSVNQEEIDKKILKILGDFKVSDDYYKKYLDFTNKNLENIIKLTKERQTSINLQIGRLQAKKEKYIKNNMHFKKDDEEKEIYEKEKENFDNQIKFLRKELENLDDIERDGIFELEMFIDMLNNAKKYYEKANYVQKKKIIKILFLNIKINSKKELIVQIKPELQTLFNPVWWR